MEMEEDSRRSRFGGEPQEYRLGHGRSECLSIQVEMLSR